MKLKRSKHQSGTPAAEASLAQFCVALDRAIPNLRTALIVAGIIAAAARTGAIADFLFVTGLLFHFAISFEHWWIAKRTR
jgi:hypothetical protein